MYELRKRSQQRVLQHLLCLSASNVSPDHSKEPQKMSPKAPMKQEKNNMYELRERSHQRVLQDLLCLSVSNVSPKHNKEPKKMSRKAPIKQEKILDKHGETRPRLFTRLQHRRMEGEGAACLPVSILRCPSKTFPVTNDSRPRVKRLSWKIPQVQVME